LTAVEIVAGDALQATTLQGLGNSIHGASELAAPADSDEIAIVDSQSGNVLKKMTWADLLAAIGGQQSVTAPDIGPIKALTSQELSLYWPALISGADLVDCAPALAISGSKIIRNGLRIDHGSAASASLSVSVTEKVRGTPLFSMSAAVSVVDSSELSGDTVKVLPIGDSLTSQAALISRMNTLAVAAGFAVTGVGTQGSAPNSHEGRPGWSWAAFNGASSPLFSAGTLNWSAYLATVGITPDVISWLLGTNSVLSAIDGLGRAAAIAAAVSAAAADIAHAEVLIAAAQAVIPSVPHIIMLPPTGTTGQSGFGENYGSDRPQHIYHAAMLAYRSALTAAFEGRESEFIYLAELGALIDPKYGGQISDVTISAYNSGTVAESTNGVHYSSSGYAELAAAYLPPVCYAYLLVPSTLPRIITFATTSAPYVRTWTYDNNLLTEYDGATWDSSSAAGAYQSDARAGLAVPANSSVTSGELSVNVWVDGSSGNRPSPGTVLSVAVHPSGLYIAYGLQVSPWLRIHKRASVGGAWSNLDISGMSPPTDRVYGLAWSNDGTRLAVGKYASSPLVVYEWAGEVLSNKVTPASQPTGTTTSIAWRHDDSAIILGNLSSPFIDAYSRSGNTYTKVANPAALPSANCRTVAFSPDGTVVACAVQHANALAWYDWSGSALTAKTAPASMPSGNGFSVCWIDDSHLCIGHGGTTGAAYLASYTVTGGLLVQDSAPVPLSALAGSVTTARVF